MPIRTLADGSLQTYGLITAQDLLDIATFYKKYFSLDFPTSDISGNPTPGKTATAVIFNTLRNAVATAASAGHTSGSEVDVWDVSLPDTVATSDLDKSTTWGVPKSTFEMQLFEYTRPGTYTITAPTGTIGVKICRIQAGGGWGGGGSQNRGGDDGSGGGGGSGGYRDNILIPSVVGGDTITVVVGGVSGTSSVAINGTVHTLCTGGGGGGDGTQGGPSGGAGYPNGNAGGHGSYNEYAIGGIGANSPLGRGGANYNMWEYDETGWGGSGYGAGGQGGGSYHQSHHGRHTSSGGSGSGGCVQIIAYGPAFDTSYMPPLPPGADPP